MSKIGICQAHLEKLQTAAEWIEGCEEINPDVVRRVTELIGNGQAMAMIVMVMRQKLGASPGDPVIRSQVQHALGQRGLFITS